MAIESVTCPIHNLKMKIATSSHGSYWRCPKWGCEQKANSMGELLTPKDEEDSDVEEHPDGFKKRRRWEE